MNIAINPAGAPSLPIPVSPLRPPEFEHIDLKAPTEAVKSVEPVAKSREPLGRSERTFEQSLPLAAPTKRALLRYQEEHPLNGPHPTD